SSWVIPPLVDAFSIVPRGAVRLRDPGRGASGTLGPSGSGSIGRLRAPPLVSCGPSQPAFGGAVMARSRPRHTQPRRRAARRATRAKTSRVRIVVADSQAIDRGGLVGLLED